MKPYPPRRDTHTATPPHPAPTVNNNSDRSDDLDDLLQRIKSQHHEPPQPPADPDEDPFAHIKQQHQNQPKIQPAKPDSFIADYQQLKTQHQAKHQHNTQPPKPNQPTIDPLDQLRQHHHQKQDTPPDLPIQNVDEIRLAEQRRQQQQKHAIAQAKKWLNQLQPYSEEGMWFEQFAESYPTRLDAAIDYLKALKDQ